MSECGCVKTKCTHFRVLQLISSADSVAFEVNQIGWKSLSSSAPGSGSCEKGATKNRLLKTATETANCFPNPSERPQFDFSEIQKCSRLRRLIVCRVFVCEEYF